MAPDNFLDTHYSELVEDIRNCIPDDRIFKVDTLLEQIPTLNEHCLAVNTQTILIRAVLRNMVEYGECERVSQQKYRLVRRR